VIFLSLATQMASRGGERPVAIRRWTGGQRGIIPRAHGAAMRRANAACHVSEHELRTDATVVKYPDRYTDKRGSQMWNEVIGLLEQHHEMQRRKDAAADA
jgi:hypothetical protein